jgi:hypothetical protein
MPRSNDVGRKPLLAKLTRMPLTLRPASPADLPVLANLMNVACRGIGPNASWNMESRFSKAAAPAKRLSKERSRRNLTLFCL